MKRRRDQTGNTLIEFAVSLLLISTTFTGAFQFGYSLYIYNRLVNAVREGARYASLQPLASINSDPDLPVAVRKLVVYGDPKPGPDARPAISGLSEKNVQVVAGAKTVTVVIRSFQIDGPFSTLNLDGRPTVTFPCARK